MVGTIEFDGYLPEDIEKAIAAVTEANAKLGLTMYSLKKALDGYDTDRRYIFQMQKTDTPEHFKCLASEAKCLGWE